MNNMEWRNMMYARLSRANITKITETSIRTPADFHVGPVLRVQAYLSIDDEVSKITIDIALNQHQQEVVGFVFTLDAEPSPLRWRKQPNVGMVVVGHVGPQRVADQIVRLLAMRAVEGYTEHAESVHQAFVAFADI